MITTQDLNFILKKYFNNNLKVLTKISKLTQEQNFAYYHQIEKFLNRGRNQISNILAILEKDNLIERDKSHRPQKIFLTRTGRELLERIKSFLI
jgi:Mn-dependent DtxR family transcriptional regulator